MRVTKRQPYISLSSKQRTKLLLMLSLLLCAIFTANRLKEPQQFPIRHVKVYGIQHIDQADIRRLLQPLVSKGFFGVQVERVKERLLQNAWVADVSVRRTWPDQVVVSVSERNPIASWNNHGLLSANGELFNPGAKSFPAKLPHFVGPEGEQIHMLRFYAKINNLLAPLHFKITNLELTSYQAWNITLDNGMKVNAGYKDVLTRLSHFVKVYPKIVGERAVYVDYVDLRYPNGLAVRWKTVT